MPDIRQTGFLDDCQRSDEDPLFWDGRWARMFSAGSWLKLHNNSITMGSPLGGTSQSSYWTPSSFSGDQEVWGIGGGGYDIREGLRLYMCMTNPTDPHGACGYRMQNMAGVTGSGCSIDRFDNGTATILASGAFVDMGFSDIYLFRRTGNLLELWVAYDGDDQNWTLLCSAIDSNYHFGYIGLGTAQDDPNPGWGGFGGGKIHRSQIYRYVSN